MSLSYFQTFIFTIVINLISTTCTCPSHIRIRCFIPHYTCALVLLSLLASYLRHITWATGSVYSGLLMASNDNGTSQFDFKVLHAGLSLLYSIRTTRTTARLRYSRNLLLIYLLTLVYVLRSCLLPLMRHSLTRHFNCFNNVNLW